MVKTIEVRADFLRKYVQEWAEVEKTPPVIVRKKGPSLKKESVEEALGI